MLEKIKATANFIKERINDNPEIGIILGTGLGGLVNEIKIIESIPYTEIPDFPVSTVDGHAGRLIYGTLGEKKCWLCRGVFIITKVTQ
jgi:purine-nucleoside phosphorylase